MSAQRNAGSSASLAIIARQTGRVLAQTPIRDERNPHLIPAPQTVVWHYVRYQFFEALLQTQALRLRRLDSQSDKEDGLLLEANQIRQSPEVKQLLKEAEFSVAYDWPAHQQTNKVLRELSFVHCWSIRTRESAWMWWSCLKDEHRSVAIRSSVGRLRVQPGLAPNGGVGLARVRYYPRSQPKPDWSYTAPFLAKDESFKREQELRILKTEPLENLDEQDFRMVRVDLNSLIDRVVVHPMAKGDFRGEVQSKLQSNGLTHLVTRSSLSELDLRNIKAKHGQRA